MLLVNTFLEGLAGPLAAQNPRQELAGLVPATQAQPFAGFHFQEAGPACHSGVPHAPPKPALAAQPGAPAVGTHPGPGILHRDLYASPSTLNPCNLEIGQAQ